MKYRRKQLIGGKHTVVSREDGSERVTFKCPLGFEVIATIKGVCFTGTSTYYNLSQLGEIVSVIWRAHHISKEMQRGRGIVPECESKYTLITRKTKTGFMAWYREIPNIKAAGGTANEAVARLREDANTF